MLIKYPEIVESRSDENFPSVRLLVDASDSSNALSVQNVRLPMGSDGAPPHFHRLSSEFFFIVDGEMEFLYDGEVQRLSAGDSVLVPSKMIHAFAAAPNSEAEVLIVIAPGVERFEYFRTLGRMMSGNAAADELVKRQDEFDTYFASNSVWSDRRSK